MSRKYVRKTLRASWAVEDLEEAMRSARNKEMGVNEASKHFGIPSRTLRRHLLTGKSKGPLGRTPVFSSEHENKLIAHIKKFEKVGFAPERKDVKEMAFQLAKKLNIKNPFSTTLKAAGDVWFNGFMARNSELSQRKSEGLSLARAYGVNRKDVHDFFDLLAKIYGESDLANHPEDVYNMDESGIQVNNKPGTVVATKGARDVYTLMGLEKGENVSVVACCNAQGNFLPPVLIYKGTYDKPDFIKGLPPESQVYMNKKSSYINANLFIKWFEEVFLRHKSPRKTLFVLDGHSSHSNNIRLLEVARDNDVILLCLPSHTTHALQPLDRAFFSPLKIYFAQEAKAYMVRSKSKKLTRYDVSELIGRAWVKAATISNGISALESCGIYPYNPSAVPEHYFSVSDSLQNQDLVENEENQNSSVSPSMLKSYSQQSQNFDQNAQHRISRESTPSILDYNLMLDQNLDENLQHKTSTESPSLFQDENELTHTIALIHLPQKHVTGLRSGSPRHKITKPHKADLILKTPPKNQEMNVDYAKPGPSGLCTAMIHNKTPLKITGSTEFQTTPSKVLSEIHPVPKLPVVLSKRKQGAIVLTSPENIEKRRLIEAKKKPKDKIEQMKHIKSTKNKKVSETKKTKATKKEDGYQMDNAKEGKKIIRKGPVRNKKIKRVRRSSSSESNDENEPKINTSEEEISEDDINKCAECTEDYYQTQSTEDWLQCTSCLAWLHEFCTMYNHLCNRCGRKAKRESIKK